MKNKLLLAIICFISQFALTHYAHAAGNSDSSITINGKPMTAEQRQEYQQTYGFIPKPGHYWYDSKTGMVGNMGEPMAGTINLGHDFGVMPKNASNGHSGVIVNGRELTDAELQLYSINLGNIKPGRYQLTPESGWSEEGRSQPTATPTVKQAKQSVTSVSPIKVNKQLDQNLVGVYQGESIASGYGSYVNTQLNWVFQPDGTVLYGATSAYSTSNQGSSQRDVQVSATGQTGSNVDRGRWSTSGDILTIQWSNGNVARYNYSFYDNMLVYRDPQTNELINYYPRIQ